MTYLKDLTLFTPSMQTQTNYSRYASNAFDNLMKQSLTPERLVKCIEAYNWESGYAWGDDARTHAEKMVTQLCAWYESLYNEEYTPSDLTKGGE